MDQLLSVLSRPTSAATWWLWGTAGLAALAALLHLIGPAPRRQGWSRWVAAAFPLSVAWTLVVGSVVGQLRGTPYDVGMVLRMAGFWASVVSAPAAVGQAVGLRPPAWLHWSHAGLAVGFLTLLPTSDLVFTRLVAADPPAQFGPLSAALLVPVAALAGWWLLSCLGRVTSRTGLVLFALGSSTTALALVIAALVVDPELADHFLMVAFLPLLVAAEFIVLRRVWSDRRTERR